jgi:hypothetical protein
LYSSSATGFLWARTVPKVSKNSTRSFGGAAISLVSLIESRTGYVDLVLVEKTRKKKRKKESKNPV